MTAEILLRVEGLRTRYAAANVLHGIDLEVRESETVFILGPNGAGKSTLLRCLAGRVSGEGRVLFRGEDILSRRSRDLVRRGLVLCPEGRHLFPEMTVRENLVLGAHLRADGDEVAKDLRRIAQHVPWLVGRLEQPAGKLSGGEQQLVAVARALMARPRLLLLDEPTVGLSAAAIAELQEWLRLQSKEYGVTILGTEQNVVFAKDIADRLAILFGGRIRSIGAADELFPEGAERSGLADRFFRTTLPPNPGMN